MHLLAFLKDWLAWAETGPMHNPYPPKYPVRYCLLTAANYYGTDKAVQAEVKTQLQALLDAEFVVTTNREERDYNTNVYPFGGIDVYTHERAHHAVCKNPARLAWVAKHIRRLETCSAQASKHLKGTP